MHQFHEILAQYTPLVEGYVLDARSMASGRALVKLTVLVHPDTSRWLMNQMYVRLAISEGQEDLRAIAVDFDLGDVIARTVSFTVIVRHLEPQEGVRHA